LVLALLIFGPKKLPEIGRTLGRGLGEFRRASSDLKRSFDLEMREMEREPLERERQLATPAATVARPSGSPAEGEAPAPDAAEDAVAGDALDPAKLAGADALAGVEAADLGVAPDAAASEGTAEDATAEADGPGSPFHRPLADPRGEDD
jgi:sec-independent protein translocase protein TatB